MPCHAVPAYPGVRIAMRLEANVIDSNFGKAASLAGIAATHGVGARGKAAHTAASMRMHL